MAKKDKKPKKDKNKDKDKEVVEVVEVIEAEELTPTIRRKPTKAKSNTYKKNFKNTKSQNPDDSDEVNFEINVELNSIIEDGKELHKIRTYCNTTDNTKDIITNGKEAIFSYDVTTYCFPEYLETELLRAQGIAEDTLVLFIESTKDVEVTYDENVLLKLGFQF